MNMQTSPNDISNKEILQELRKHTERFDKIDTRFDGIDARLGGLEASNQEILEVTNSYATVVDDKLSRLEREQTRMSANMVTKGYLDDKLADQYSKIVEHTTRKIEKAMG